MNLEELAQNDVAQNKNMNDDPKWTSAERQRYQAAYSAAKQSAEDRA